jgi:hypothetical protein
MVWSSGEVKNLQNIGTADNACDAGVMKNLANIVARSGAKLGFDKLGRLL